MREKKDWKELRDLLFFSVAGALMSAICVALMFKIRVQEIEIKRLQQEVKVCKEQSQNTFLK